MKFIGIIKQPVVEQIEINIRNLSRLADQEIDWFIERIEANKKGDYKRAQFIEGMYLNPLNRKIKELAERMSRISL